MDQLKEQRTSQIQSLTRAVAVLDAITHTEHGATLAEITTATGMNRTTVWRLVTSLRDLGMVRANQNGRFTLAARVLAFGAVARAQLLVSPETPVVLRRLRDLTGETCHCAGPDGNGMVYLDKLEGTRSVRAASTVGGRLQLHCTALGKTYLAFAEDSVREQLMDSLTLEPRTQRTITELPVLRAELMKIRNRGWALDNEENEEDIRCVAAPVIDGQGKVVAAVSVSVPMIRLPLSEVRNLAREVVRAVQDLSRVFAVGHSSIG